ncbi:hypothetical protein [Megavirus chiliensis]|uniref:Transcription accessory protein (S1 RNA-binding domain) n=2 Tax=Megamimivirinae TaxID=3044648 RepID=A0A2L2DL40_MIMIV|nr:hypothetical protein MegaChil _gp0030 [Megavirus chiliensis]AEQ32472.1 hypothetical protein [Megavirus chiliensis]AVG46875.1 Transcription accessory protein (S1 RNA-binding domain) [Acanthamoeba polyphaga mimivirus]
MQSAEDFEKMMQSLEKMMQSLEKMMQSLEKMMQSLEKMTRKEIWDKLYERRYQYEKYYAPQPYKPFMLPNGQRIHEDIKGCIPNTVTHLSFGHSLNTDTPKEALENAGKEETCKKNL